MRSRSGEKRSTSTAGGNFGDLYADHEARAGGWSRTTTTSTTRSPGSSPASSRPAITWWCLADDLAGHVTDIDLYHTTRDRAAYNGGYFWHTQHYQAGGHRHASRLFEADGLVRRRAVGRAQLHDGLDAALTS